MKGFIARLLALALAFAPELAAAQSTPGFTNGQVPTATQWNGYFAAKQDLLSGGSNSILGNPTASTAAPVFMSMPDCHGATNALIWTPASGFGCNTGGGGVSSVGTTSGTLVVSPTTGAVLADIDLTHANTWTGAQTFSGGLISTTGSFSTPLTAASGGSGRAALTAHSILAGNGASAVTLLAPGTAGNVLMSNGAGADPTFQALGGGGTVSSIVNSDGTLTISPTTGAAVASLALGHANTWTGAQAFDVLTAATAIAATSGGTGHASYTAHMSLVATSTTALTGKVLPDCPDSSGQHINFTQSTDAYSCGTTSGGGPGGGSTMPYLSKSANYSALNTDNGSLIEVTGSAVLTLQTTSPTMTSGWFAILSNTGTNTSGWTITPSSGTIDGVASTYSYIGEVRLIEYDGTNFHSKVLTPFAVEFLTAGAGSLIWPSGCSLINWELIGGGGGGSSGGSGTNNYNAGGGGGGATKPGFAKAPAAGTTINFTVAATASGGAGATNSVGTIGTQGASTILTGYDTAPGGGPGSPGNGSGGTGYGGGGAGTMTAGSAGGGPGAPPASDGNGASFAGGGGRGGTVDSPSGHSDYGGGGGGLSNRTNGYAAGGSFYGAGGGGAGSPGSGTIATRGGSSHNYGTGSGGAIGVDGTPPTAGGAGAAGSWATHTAGSGGGGGGAATTTGYNGSLGGAGGQPGGGGGGGGWTPDPAGAGNTGGAGAAGAVRLWCS